MLPVEAEAGRSTALTSANLSVRETTAAVPSVGIVRSGNLHRAINGGPCSAAFGVHGRTR